MNSSGFVESSSGIGTDASIAKVAAQATNFFIDDNGVTMPRILFISLLNHSVPAVVPFEANSIDNLRFPDTYYDSLTGCARSAAITDPVVFPRKPDTRGELLFLRQAGGSLT